MLTIETLFKVLPIIKQKQKQSKLNLKLQRKQKLKKKKEKKCENQWKKTTSKLWTETIHSKL